MQEKFACACSIKHLVVVIAILLWTSVVSAQTSSFTYQGRLTDGGTSANGNYDLQFALFDSLSGGAQVGSTQTLNTVAVSSGVFTVSLDFGASAFNGANRFLEISARPAGSGTFTLLSPRQQITSTPYAVRSLNATTADSVPASGVPSGSSNYIQNSTSQQATSNFHISGNGTAGGTLSGGVVNAANQFNLNGIRILSSPGNFTNLFAGNSAGTANTTGFSNSFFGTNAGRMNTEGAANSFFGESAGFANTMGVENAFFGSVAGQSNTTGEENAFFGAEAGRSNTTGSFNAFFGTRAGLANTAGAANVFVGTESGVQNSTGNFNSFFGEAAGRANTSGSFNAFLGDFAGQSNTAGDNNTAIGFRADVLAGPTNATAIGARAQVTANNSLVLGSIKNVNGATEDTNVGIGTTAPQRLLHIRGTGSNGLGRGDLLVTSTGTVGSAITLEATPSGGNTFSWISTGTGAFPGAGLLAAFDVNNTAYRMVIDSAGRIGIGTTAPDQQLSVNGNASKTSGGAWAVFSDERLKTIKGRFNSGLQAVMQLQPLRYEYKRDNALALKSDGEQIGFSAQAVQKIIPEAVITNDKGYLLVNNDPILWTMLNAIKEQQAQIEKLQQVNSTLKARLRRLERAVPKSASALRRR